MKNLLWCPIDIPKIPNSFNECVGEKWLFWNKTNFTEKQETPYNISQWTKHALETYPEFIKWFEYLPYKSIRNIKFNVQMEAVKPHIDFTQPKLKPELFENNVDNEPCGYRILIAGKRNNSLYVMNKDSKIYCNMPDDTDVYVLGHTSTLHGVEDELGRKTIFVHIEIDKDKHNEILMRSVEKYKQYAIWNL